MSKDYKGYNSKPKKARRKTNSKKPLLWFAVFAIVVLAAFAGYWYLKHDYHPHKEVLPAKKSVPVKAPAKMPPKKPSVNFEFYNILTKQTVSVPNPVVATPKAAQSTATYIVQVASLKDANVADSFKAKLALDGFNVQVKPIVNSSGNKWYRVQIGPYNTFDDAYDVLNNLRKNHFDGMVKKVAS